MCALFKQNVPGSNPGTDRGRRKETEEGRQRKEEGDRDRGRKEKGDRGREEIQTKDLSTECLLCA